MNHPSDEELSDFIYDELPPDRRSDVAAHLNACGECGARVAEWRDVRGALQSWTVPDVRRSPVTSRPRLAGAVRWAVAACVFVASGYGLARLTMPQQDTVARLDPAVVDTLRAELKRDLSVQLTALHREYRDGVDRQIRQIEAARLAEYSGLRKDVETVALRTQEEFLRLGSAAPNTASLERSN